MKSSLLPNRTTCAVALVLATLAALLATPAELRAAPAQSPWEAHLAKMAANSKCKAAIFGLDGAQWAGLTQWNPKPDEMKYTLGGFANPDTLRQKGPTLAGVKYMATVLTSDRIALKKSDQGVVLAKTAKAVAVCAFSEKDLSPLQATAAVQGFAHYLQSIGF